MKFLMPSVGLMLCLAVVAAATQGRPDTRGDDRRRQRFAHGGHIDQEAVGAGPERPEEAPTGFDNLTNGIDPQGPAFESSNEDNVVPLRSFNDNRFIFEEVETIGRRPRPDLQRAVAAASATRTSSPAAPARSPSIAPAACWRGSSSSRWAARWCIRARRTPTSSNAWRRGRHPHVPHLDQHAGRAATSRRSPTARCWRSASAAARRCGASAVVVPVLEGNGAARIGRFGWKNQHASLESFSADAYLNEMGITSPLFPDENTSSGRDVVGLRSGRRSRRRRRRRHGVRQLHAFDQGAVARPDHADGRGRRAGVPPDRLRHLSRRLDHHGAGRHADQRRGVHRAAALGNKMIHPYSDFLPHDIGTGDGIPMLPLPEYADTASQDAHRAAVGAAHPQSADARRPVVHPSGGHRPPPARSRAGAEALPGTDRR